MAAEQPHCILSIKACYVKHFVYAKPTRDAKESARAQFTLLTDGSFISSNTRVAVNTVLHRSLVCLGVYPLATWSFTLHVRSLCTESLCALLSRLCLCCPKSSNKPSLALFSGFSSSGSRLNAIWSARDCFLLWMLLRSLSPVNGFEAEDRGPDHRDAALHHVLREQGLHAPPLP